MASTLAALSLDERAVLHDFLHLRSVKVATACSGTDNPIIQLESLRSFLAQSWHCDVTLRHEFSCEFNKRKQEFIKKVAPSVGAIFPDIQLLGNPEMVNVKDPTWPMARHSARCVLRGCYSAT